MRALLRTITIRGRDDGGQILMLTALMLAVLLGMVALVIDVGNFLRERGHRQTVVDAAALAGAQELPDDPTQAQNRAIDYALANDPTLSPADLLIQFYCLVGDDDNNGVPDPYDIPAACDPGTNASWTCAGGLCYSPCFGAEGDKCNVIWVGNAKDVDFVFSPILGITGENTGQVDAAACRGSCGSSVPVPIDVVMIIDRTGSMGDSTDCGLPGTETELDCAKDAAKTMLEALNPNFQHVALGVLGAGDPSNPCNDLHPSSGGTWLAVGFSSDYKVNGALNPSSEIVQTIECLNHSSQGTNLGSPVQDDYYGQPDAVDELLNNGRPNVQKAIVLFTDGAANQPTGTSSNTGWLNCAAQAAVTSSSGDNNGFETSPANGCGNNSADAGDINSGTGTSTSCSSTAKDRHRFYNFGISIPSGHTVDGIQVMLEDARVDANSGTRYMCVELSWDGGVTWTSAQTTSSLSTSRSDYTLGSSTNTWGHTWSASDLSNANFRVRVTNVDSSTSRDFYLDAVQVRVYHSLVFDSCKYAYDMATAAKANDIEIFTLGYGLESEDCVYDGPSSPYYGLPVTRLLGDMATDSYDETGCDTSSEAAQENADGDNFYCETDAAGLQSIFQAAAESLATGSRLVRLP